MLRTQTSLRVLLVVTLHVPPHLLHALGLLLNSESVSLARNPTPSLLAVIAVAVTRHRSHATATASLELGTVQVECQSGVSSIGQPSIRKAAS
jgi:hypothetical protein